MKTFEEEVKKGQRFEFGKNWRSFLSTLTEERIDIAKASTQDMLRVDNLNGKTFLDIGSGSGLFSLVARKLGAKVHSFDYDPSSVNCTKELQSRFFPGDPDWSVERGSALDKTFLESLGQFDIVYSWGVLHHTGKMWDALGNAASLVKEKGTLYIALYHDQGALSALWKKVKAFYCSGFLGKMIMSSIFIPYFFVRTVLASLYRKENQFSAYKKKRGMSVMHDWFDWLGGYPFEVASVEAIFHFFQKRGFTLVNIKSDGGLGNNHFVFVRE